MDWHPLATYPDDLLWRGTVLRLLKAEWPHEAPLDLLLVDDYDSPCGITLVVSTGYKAGAVLVKLPAEARAQPDALALSRRWLQAHWTEWVYPSCPAEQVLVCAGYAPGVTAP